MEIENKVIFITGGAGGIGFAMVKELLENNAKGVAIVDVAEDSGRRAVAEIDALFGKGKAIFIRTDVSKKAELEDAFEKTVQFYKQLDIVINNAGITNESEWEKVLDINLIGVINGSYLAMKKYLLEYKSGEEGVIINTSSLMGLNPSEVTPIYSVSKAGVLSLGGALGGDEFYKKYKVRVMTICPGLVYTDLLGGSADVKAVFPHKIKDDLKKFRCKVQPAKCVAEALIRMIKNGKNGSIWVVENSEEPYEVVIPDRNEMRK